MKDQSKKAYYRELVEDRIKARQKDKKPFLCLWIPGKKNEVRYSFRVDPVGKNVEKYLVTFVSYKARKNGPDKSIRNVFHLNSI